MSASFSPENSDDSYPDKLDLLTGREGRVIFATTSEQDRVCSCRVGIRGSSDQHVEEQGAVLRVQGDSVGDFYSRYHVNGR
jgi:hypothetical protein